MTTPQNSITYAVTHVTTYTYAVPVSVSQNVARITPRVTPVQTVRDSRITVTPHESWRSDDQDSFGNQATYFAIETEHTVLRVEGRALVSLLPNLLPDAAGTPPWEAVRDRLATAGNHQDLKAYAYAFDSPFARTSDRAYRYALPSFPAGRPFLQGVIDLSSRIFKDFTYDPTATTVATPLDEVMTQKRGVCQDFAHLMLACLRSLGLAARYVSGYLLTYPPPGEEKLVGSDASHAWGSVYLPDVGWIDIDPTNDKLTGLEHITTAWGRDFSDVSPLKGVMLGGGENTVDVAVDVAPVMDETVRSLADLPAPSF